MLLINGKKLLKGMGVMFTSFGFMVLLYCNIAMNCNETNIMAIIKDHLMVDKEAGIAVVIILAIVVGTMITGIIDYWCSMKEVKDA